MGYMLDQFMLDQGHLRKKMNNDGNLVRLAVIRVEASRVSELSARSLPERRHLNGKRQAEACLFFLTDSSPVSYFVPLASFPMREKSGRYIEMTMPPMVTPRKAIRTGSINASRSAMAVSTSSS